MPIVSTWIRNEDWDKYYQLHTTKQWTEFIHNALNQPFMKVRPLTEDDKTILRSRPQYAEKPIKSTKIIKTAEDAAEVVKEVFPESKPITYKKTGNWGA